MLQYSKESKVPTNNLMSRALDCIELKEAGKSWSESSRDIVNMAEGYRETSELEP